MGAFSSSLLLLFRQIDLVVDRAAQVSPKVILQSDLHFDASFAYLTVRASKTIQFRECLFSLLLLRIPGSLLCPVADSCSDLPGTPGLAIILGSVC